MKPSSTKPLDLVDEAFIDQAIYLDLSDHDIGVGNWTNRLQNILIYCIKNFVATSEPVNPF